MPTQIFITDSLPKGPTGKVQRRFMADHFIKKKPAGGVEQNKTAATSGGSGAGGVPPAPAPATNRSTACS